MRFSRTVNARSSAAARALLVCVAVLLAAPAARARELVDATGAKVSVLDHPVRIVTLAPSLAELAADLEGENLERIVGVSEYTDYPPALAKRPTIGSYAHFNLEKVLALKPDLVLATTDGNPKDQVLHLRELGLPVVVVATSSLADVERSMRLVGQAVGEEKAGAEMAAQLERGIENFRARAKARPAGAPKARVLLEVGDLPLIVAGGGTFLNEALATVGAENIYGGEKTHYPRPSVEDVLRRDPDTIIILALGKDRASFDAMARRWGQFTGVTAVKRKRVFVLQGDTVTRPSMRLLEGFSLLERAVYGGK